MTSSLPSELAVSQQQHQQPLYRLRQEILYYITRGSIRRPKTEIGLCSCNKVKENCRIRSRKNTRKKVIMVLPLLKLGTLAVKTLSKPLASRLKQQAALHPKFRQFIVNIAQSNHRITTRTQRRIYGHATDVEIRPLNEEKAVQAAVDLIGEVFVFTVAGAVVIFEVQRSAKSETRKEEKRKQELEAMKQRDEDLAKEVELLKQKLQEIEQLAKGRGLGGIFQFKHSAADEGKTAKSL